MVEQAGARLDILGRELGKHAQMLALDPCGGPSRTVGGVLATNASGPLRFAYGTARDLVIGLPAIGIWQVIESNRLWRRRATARARITELPPAD